MTYTPGNTIVPDTVTIADIEIDALEMREVLDRIGDCIENKGSGNYVCLVNVHTLMAAQRDLVLKKVLNGAFLTLPDGMPLVWVGRRQESTIRKNIRGSDLFAELTRISVQKGYRHFYYGGDEGVPERLREVMQLKYPGLKVVGTYSPPFRPLTPQEEEHVRLMIASSQADIIWVGLGAPKQEKWMASHAGIVAAPVMIGIGAAFNFHTGLIKEAPAWMRNAGLEWFYRLCQEPRRLFTRYLKYNTMFILRILSRK